MTIITTTQNGNHAISINSSALSQINTLNRTFSELLGKNVNILDQDEVISLPKTFTFCIKYKDNLAGFNRFVAQSTSRKKKVKLGTSLFFKKLQVLMNIYFFRSLKEGLQCATAINRSIELLNWTAFDSSDKEVSLFKKAAESIIQLITHQKFFREFFTSCEIQFKEDLQEKRIRSKSLREGDLDEILTELFPIEQKNSGKSKGSLSESEESPLYSDSFYTEPEEVSERGAEDLLLGSFPEKPPKTLLCETRIGNFVFRTFEK